jgi:hypothetical protein
MATKLFQSPNFLGAHIFWATPNFTYIRGFHILYFSTLSFHRVRLSLFWTIGVLHFEKQGKESMHFLLFV